MVRGREVLSIRMSKKRKALLLKLFNVYLSIFSVSWSEFYKADIQVVQCYLIAHE